jgi:D-alanine-D-alanine ligase-like ATP-grasp enzyme
MGPFTLPKAWTFEASQNLTGSITECIDRYPVVAKPIRGRGSHGVKLCASPEELSQHLEDLGSESPVVMVEEFLAGEEATVTVMPPSPSRPEYWALPLIARFNHESGIAPYSGVVAVTANSRVISPNSYGMYSRYDEAARECLAVVGLLGVTAPIRIDIRRFDNEGNDKFTLFDVNMKPVNTNSMLRNA